MFRSSMSFLIRYFCYRFQVDLPATQHLFRTNNLFCLSASREHHSLLHTTFPIQRSWKQSSPCMFRETKGLPMHWCNDRRLYRWMDLSYHILYSNGTSLGSDKWSRIQKKQIRLFCAQLRNRTGVYMYVGQKEERKAIIS